jgi:hypothetical protein
MEKKKKYLEYVRWGEVAEEKRECTAVVTNCHQNQNQCVNVTATMEKRDVLMKPYQIRHFVSIMNIHVHRLPQQDMNRQYQIYCDMTSR